MFQHNRSLDDVQLSINSTTHRVTAVRPLELLLVGRVDRPLNLGTVDDYEVEADMEKIREQASGLMENSACNQYMAWHGLGTQCIVKLYNVK